MASPLTPEEQMQCSASIINKVGKEKYGAVID